MALNLDALTQQLKPKAPINQEPEKQAGESKLLPVSLLDAHPLYGKGVPYRASPQSRIDQLAESIRCNGILSPLLVRPMDGGRYQILAGHTRKAAAMKIGYTELPCIIKNVDEEDGVNIFITDNLMQRPGMNISEKAAAYAMKLENIKKRHKERNNSTDGQIGHPLISNKSIDLLAKEVGESRKQVQRFIRLTELIQPLLDMVDNRRIGMTIGVELSYLAKPTQELLNAYLQQNPKAGVSAAIAAELRQLDETSGETITWEELEAFFVKTTQRAPRVLKLQLKPLRKFFPPGSTPEDMAEIIETALSLYYRKEEENAEKQ